MSNGKIYNENLEEDKIKQALLERPGFSIKARLSLFLLILFFLTALISGVGMFLMYKIDNSIQYIFLSDKISNEIQYARRIEKNYLLYNSSLKDIRIHLNNTKELLDRASREFKFVAGKQEIKDLSNDLKNYRELAEFLILHSNDTLTSTQEKILSSVQSFRNYGSKMLNLSLEISKKERALVSKTVSTAHKVQILLLIISLITMIIIIISLSRHIISRLNRLMEATQNIASGTFSPITPQRKYRDEFSILAIAFNHMMYELEKRQNLLVESHKLRAIGNLTAGIAHELNNPINNIILTSEMLKEDFNELSDYERLDMLNDIAMQAERSRQVVSNLLDFARESETKAEHFPIDDLIDTALRLVKNQLKINKVKIKKNIIGTFPQIYGDKKQFVQVFINLFINAIDSMPNGGTLSIDVEEEKDSGFLAVKVKDTGKGIPAHILKSIFNPFFTTKPEGTGTGLGLSVSKGIIEKHGGDIEVESELDKGTTFTVYLPLVPIPANIKKH